ncbi:MAG: 23S rRNA (adenine(2503)-C(2))-methyltransferase RlmN [Candidatus Aquicultorales bacterium]
MEKKDVKGLPAHELADALAPLSLPKFRIKQIMSWIYAKDTAGFSAMTNLPNALRTKLNESFYATKLQVKTDRKSADGTVKLLLELRDGVFVESVGIPEGRRLTVCFSTQVGCAMACGFCATGQGGYVRNLTPGEIVDQVQRVGAYFGERVSNAVAMGQGEPFANYEATLGALRVMNDKDGLRIGARHLTVSTCGIVPGIERFGEEFEQFGLAVSIHSAIQEKRAALMPVSRRYPIGRLRRACARYAEKSNRRVTFEYALVRGVNDGAEDLEALIAFCSGLLCHVNLIPLNPVHGYEKMRSDKAAVLMFHKGLNDKGIEASIRVERGTDIEAACGQLSRIATS